MLEIHKGVDNLKHLIGTIYLSIGILLLAFDNFDHYYPTRGFKFFVLIIILVGIIYLLRAFIEWFKSQIMNNKVNDGRKVFTIFIILNINQTNNEEY